MGDFRCASYDVIQDSRGTVAVVGGARYLTADVDVTLGAQGPLNLASPLRSVSSSASYIDGFVGVRGFIKLGEHWYLPYYADIGTGESELTWQALAGVGYRFSWGDIKLVYRYLGYDFGDDNRLQNLAISGPALGIGIRF